MNSSLLAARRLYMSKCLLSVVCLSVVVVTNRPNLSRSVTRDFVADFSHEGGRIEKIFNPCFTTFIWYGFGLNTKLPKHTCFCFFVFKFYNRPSTDFGAVVGHEGGYQIKCMANKVEQLNVFGQSYFKKNFLGKPKFWEDFRQSLRNHLSKINFIIIAVVVSAYGTFYTQHANI